MTTSISARENRPAFADVYPSQERRHATLFEVAPPEAEDGQPTQGCQQCLFTKVTPDDIDR